MKFHDLDIENFLTIRNARVNLDGRGLHLIQGANDDDSSATSNGAGKSSLVDAICWALYGLTAREVKGDAVVNLAAKKDCRVTLTLSNGASHYRVTRHRKHAEGKNSLVLELKSAAPGTVATDLSRGTDAETQKVLEKILGSSYEVFMAAVYSGQEAMPDLPRMKDREIKQLVEEAAGLQRIEKAYEVARERANTIKAQVSAAETKLDTHKADLERAKMSLATVEVRHAAWETERAERVANVEKNLRDEEGALAAIKVAIEPAAESKDKAQARLKVIGSQLIDHRSLLTAAQAIDAEVRRAELAIDAGALRRLAAQVKLHQDQIANAATEVRKPCTECGTVLETMSIEDYIAHRTKHLEEAKTRLEEAKTLARTQLTALNQLKADAVAAHAAVPDVTELTAERTRCEAVVELWKAMASGMDRTAGNVKACQDQLTLRRTEANPDASALTMCRDRVGHAIAAVAAGEELLSRARKELEVAQSVVKVFGPAGVRAQILDTVTPYLNDRTADYLSALSDGEISAVWTTLTKSASGDLKEKFSIDVDHKKGGDSFAALSGGEKRKVRLATALALQDLVASRAAHSIDLWIGDEIDDALDPAGLERLMTILERKARERGTVLVISHSDLRDWVDDVTVVRKTGLWNSTVEGSLCS